MLKLAFRAPGAAIHSIVFFRHAYVELFVCVCLFVCLFVKVLDFSNDAVG